ncbi:hypothetical protein L207DRAFT_560651 [Hyaloscypha variabilis F]|uniref:C2H2-type domain-containing protein n=1 Tax=Hyaloscypha variabilis (strain UAMH 11265 / GT02V1 / F) TaxID=1149755 RepID=A0A2J6S8D2_HYAVF|nr:hypothetical protein L207DRAFT_560651 [Hyaloscypha variabilis F]
MEYYEGNMEFGAYQENVPLGYADGGTMSMNGMDWVDETTGNGLTPSLALYPQSIFTAPEGVVSDHQWSFPQTLSSYDGEAGPQLPQTHYAPPTPNNFSQPHDLQNGLNEYGDGTHIDSSVPVYQNPNTQYPFNPYTSSNTTIQTHGSRATVIDKDIYCSWDGCGQSHKTGAESRKHFKTHTKPYQCHVPGCAWKGTAEKRELKAHIDANHKPRSGPRFTCSKCKRSFTLRKNLIRHQKHKNCR